MELQLYSPICLLRVEGRHRWGKAGQQADHEAGERQLKNQGQSSCKWATVLFECWWLSLIQLKLNHFFLPFKPPTYLAGVEDAVCALIGGSAPEDLKKLSRRHWVFPIEFWYFSIFCIPLATLSWLKPFYVTRNSLSSSSFGLIHFKPSCTFYASSW